MRKATVKRETKETKISMSLNLDGSGKGTDDGAAGRSHAPRHLEVCLHAILHRHGGGSLVKHVLCRLCRDCQRATKQGKYHKKLSHLLNILKRLSKLTSS